MTIDLEDWFHANYESQSSFTKMGSIVEETTERLLVLLEKYKCKCTFFVLGSVAENHRSLVLKISRSGHEIASHGYAHQLVYQQTPEVFRNDIAKAKSLTEDITGLPCRGYRAPSWSITKESLWALEILAQLGFSYDSSIFPTRNFLYGIPDAPRYAYRPLINGSATGLVEIPPSTMRIAGLNIPFSGGFYFRACPEWLIKRFSIMTNRKKQPVIFYLHPREIAPDQPKLDLSFKNHLIHYIGIRGCFKKLESTLRTFPTVTVLKQLAGVKRTVPDKALG